MSKIAITSSNAPKAIGTYSQAIEVGNVLYCSGQIPLHPGSMEMIKGDFEKQVSQCFANLEAICRSRGASINNIVKLTIYICNINDFDIVNRVMKIFFDEPYPARAVVEVTALPKGAQIEIDAIVTLDS